MLNRECLGLNLVILNHKIRPETAQRAEMNRFSKADQLREFVAGGCKRMGSGIQKMRFWVQ